MWRGYLPGLLRFILTVTEYRFQPLDPKVGIKVHNTLKMKNPTYLCTCDLQFLYFLICNICDKIWYCWNKCGSIGWRKGCIIFLLHNLTFAGSDTWIWLGISWSSEGWGINTTWMWSKVIILFLSEQANAWFTSL